MTDWLADSVRRRRRSIVEDYSSSVDIHSVTLSAPLVALVICHCLFTAAVDFHGHSLWLSWTERLLVITAVISCCCCCCCECYRWHRPIALGTEAQWVHSLQSMATGSVCIVCSANFFLRFFFSILSKCKFWRSPCKPLSFSSSAVEAAAAAAEVSLCIFGSQLNCSVLKWSFLLLLLFGCCLLCRLQFRADWWKVVMSKKY